MSTIKIGSLTLTKTSKNGFSTGLIPFKWNGRILKFEIRETSEHAKRSWGKQQTKARAYTHVVEKVSEELLWATAKSEGLDGIYTPKGDNKNMDKAWRKFNKAEVNQMTGILEAALKVAGIETKFHFSRTAGCSCGCSPAFIIDNTWPIPGYYDIFFFASDEDAPEFVKEVSQPVKPSRFNLNDN